MNPGAEDGNGADRGGRGLLIGKVAIVTGGARGLGREHALLLAAEGARVVINDVRDADESSPADDLAAEILAFGGSAAAVTANVADWAGAPSIVACALDHFGRLDILVNNAGITLHRPFLDMAEDEWARVIAVNLTGTFLTMRAAGRHWRAEAEAGRPVAASVVNTTSRAGLFTRNAPFPGPPGTANYSAAKAGVAGLSELAAGELAQFGVRVNCISPTARTRLTQWRGREHSLDAPADSGFDSWHPGNISPFVVWLCSDHCSLTGRTFVVTGGTIALLENWTEVGRLEKPQRWTIAELVDRARIFEQLDRERPSVPEF